MGYHFTVWDGEEPTSVEQAHAIFERMYRAAHPRVELTPAIRAFVGRLAREWPDTPEDEFAGSPWKYLPLEKEAAGALFDTALTFGSASTAVPRIAALAEEMGLVWFDPQHPQIRLPIRAPWE